MNVVMLVLCIVMGLMFLLLGVAVSPIFLLGVVAAVLLFFWYKKSRQAAEQKKMDAAIKAQQEKEQEEARRRKHDAERRAQFLTFDIAGLYFHQEETSALLDNDGEYSGACQLVPEPDNPHDKNAIKVVIRGVHVGYVPAVKCSEVAERMQKAAEITADLETTNEIEGTVTIRAW